MALADYQGLVEDFARDDSGRTTTTDRDQAIALAVARYSSDRPRVLVEDIVSADGRFLDLPVAWEDGFSAIRSLEYPIGDVPPTLIAGDRWDLYRSPAALQVMLLDALAAGAGLRVNFTVAHAVDGGQDTTPAKDREAVACFAASLVLDQLAAFHAGTGDSSIGAAGTAQTSRSQDYAARARTLRGRYFESLGIDPKRAVAAGVVVDLDMTDSLGGDRLTHPARLR